MQLRHVFELPGVLYAALRESDLRGRLRAWWRVCSGAVGPTTRYRIRRSQ